MTDLGTNNGAGNGAGDISMASNKRSSSDDNTANLGAAESASFDEAPSVSDTGEGGSAGRASGEQTSGSGSEGSSGGGAMSNLMNDERLRATLQSIESRAQDMRRWAMTQQDTAREVIEDKPMVVVGAAFGIGLVLGLLAAKV
jgi:ElaB/YqjD/DUF883 family membrane-anchored ribosome-binding protein